MSQDQAFGADRHDLGCRVVHAAQASRQGLAHRAADAVRRLLGRAEGHSDLAAASTQAAAGDRMQQRLAGLRRRALSDSPTATARR